VTQPTGPQTARDNARNQLRTLRAQYATGDDTLRAVVGPQIDELVDLLVSADEG
jgi:hypothetical protein